MDMFVAFLQAMLVCPELGLHRTLPVGFHEICCGVCRQMDFTMGT
jgi:hypothetical protein